MSFLQLEVLSVEVEAAVGHARRSWTRRRAVHVRFRWQDLQGLGETSPLPGYSPDLLDDAAQGLAAWSPETDRLARWRDAMEKGDLESVLRLTEALVGEIPASLPSSRFGLETALLDAAGRYFGRPLPSLLSSTDVGWGPIRVGGLWSSVEPPTATQLSLEPDDDGADRVLKIKVGRVDGEALELDMLRRVRKRFPKLEIRLDANGAWSAEQARALKPHLKTLGVRWVEEPVLWQSVKEIAAWASSSEAVPTALDESLWRLQPSPQDLRSCRPAALILKPQVLGGVLACLRFAQAAVDIPAIVSHTFDGPIAYRAATALALALDSERGSEAHGLAAHPVLEAWTAREPGPLWDLNPAAAGLGWIGEAA